MELNDYQQLAKSTAIYQAVTDMGLIYTTLGLVGEAGELANKLKKVIRDNNGVLTYEVQEALADELGDVLWYVAMVAEELDYTLNDIATGNLTKLAARQAKGTLKGAGDDR